MSKNFKSGKRGEPDDGRASNSPEAKRPARPGAVIHGPNTTNARTFNASLPQPVPAGSSQYRVPVFNDNENQVPLNVPPRASRGKKKIGNSGPQAHLACGGSRNIGERRRVTDHQTLDFDFGLPNDQQINQQLNNQPLPTQQNNDRRGTVSQIAVNNITAGNPASSNNDRPNLPVPEGLNHLPNGRNYIKHVAEYFEDITETLYNTQGSLEDYMARQPTISPSMRAILINWTAEVIAEFNLTTETNYLAITIMDKYLQDNQIPRDQLQLLGITCLLIASKVEDVNTPTVKDFADISDNTYSAVQILQMERIVLDKLSYGFCIPTEGSFIPIYIQLVIERLGIDPSSQIYTDFVELTNYICEMAKLCYPTMVFLASIVASASAYIALHTVKRRYPNNIQFSERILSLFRINEHNKDTFRNCVNTIQNYLSDYPENLRAIPDKYQRVVNFDMPLGDLFSNART